MTTSLKSNLFVCQIEKTDVLAKVRQDKLPGRFVTTTGLQSDVKPNQCSDFYLLFSLSADCWIRTNMLDSLRRPFSPANIRTGSFGCFSSLHFHRQLRRKKYYWHSHRQTGLSVTGAGGHPWMTSHILIWSLPPLRFHVSNNLDSLAFEGLGPVAKWLYLSSFKAIMLNIFSC